MTQGKHIGSAGNRPGAERYGRGFSGWFRKLRTLFHAMPAAMSGNSSSVMDQYMKYHKEHRSA